MKKIIVCTHGCFGEELIRSAEMIGGNMGNTVAVSLLPSMAPEDYCVALKHELLKEGLNMCFVDLFGGTPCNVVMALSQEYPIELLCGVNLPMLLEATSFEQHHDIKDYKEHLLTVYQENGFDVLKRMKEREE